jgi:hypothetical protein
MPAWRAQRAVGGGGAGEAVDREEQWRDVGGRASAQATAGTHCVVDARRAVLAALGGCVCPARDVPRAAAAPSHARARAHSQACVCTQPATARPVHHMDGAHAPHPYLYTNAMPSCRVGKRPPSVHPPPTAAPPALERRASTSWRSEATSWRSSWRPPPPPPRPAVGGDGGGGAPWGTGAAPAAQTSSRRWAAVRGRSELGERAGCSRR